jgi:hypothetical protein
MMDAMGIQKRELIDDLKLGFIIKNSGSIYDLD